MSRVSTIKMTARQFLELGEDPPGVRLGSDVVKLPPFSDLQVPLGKLWRPKSKR